MKLSEMNYGDYFRHEHRVYRILLIGVDEVEAQRIIIFTLDNQWHLSEQGITAFSPQQDVTPCTITVLPLTVYLATNTRVNMLLLPMLARPRIGSTPTKAG